MAEGMFGAPAELRVFSTWRAARVRVISAAVFLLRCKI
jgi:hypothetical protein